MKLLYKGAQHDQHIRLYRLIKLEEKLSDKKNDDGLCLVVEPSHLKSSPYNGGLSSNH